jgi:hypothetical protein
MTIVNVLKSELPRFVQIPDSKMDIRVQKRDLGSLCFEIIERELDNIDQGHAAPDRSLKPEDFLFVL